MALLIDGYNLLHNSGVFGSGRGPGYFQRAREALLRNLAAALPPGERSQTTIVFDAAAAPYNLPRELKHEEITVLFAPRDRKADDVIEDLIRADSAPRRLTVVSSDHRVQNAAKRRRAKFVDSDRWWAELLRRRRAGEQSYGAAPLKPDGPLTPYEVEFWLSKFSVELESESESSSAANADSPSAPESQPAPPPESFNPFPPGYGEDLTEDDV